jgi:hypothetical protein
MGPINLNQSEEIVSPEALKVLQLVTLSMSLAVAGFMAVVVAVVGGVTPPPGAAADTLPDFLSLLHLVLAAACYITAAMLFPRILRTGGAAEGPDPVLRLRTAIIARLALMELPAMFGLMVCMLAGIRGMIAYDPVYWLNLLSAAVFLAFVGLTFPTRARLEYLLTTYAAS